MQWRLSAFTDEIADDPREAFTVLQNHSIAAIELRGAWGKNVLDLSDEELKQLRFEVGARGLSVPVVASPIGKSTLLSSEDFELGRLRRAITVARLFGAQAIRIFSFYIPHGEPPERYRDTVLRRLATLVGHAAAEGVVLLHENEKDIYGDVPSRCRDILESIGSPWLRAVWDPANFVQCGVRPYTEGFAMLSSFLTHVHIKDALQETGEVKPAGQGDGEIPETLVALSRMGYQGYLSLEPHLALAGHQGGFTGPAAFTIAVEALRHLLASLPPAAGE